MREPQDSSRALHRTPTKLSQQRSRGEVLAVCLAVAALLSALLCNPLRTLTSLRQVSEHPLYVMHYYGPYAPDLLMRTGAEHAIHDRVRQMSMPQACTCFAGLSPEGQMVFGRNFDWYEHPALLLFTDPPNGYASVSMVDIFYLGCDGQGPSGIDRAALLLAPYLPADGMNEAGLAVGMMAVPHARDAAEPNKVTIDSLRAIRMLLDHAGSTDEAISLLQKYNISFTDPPIHYLISDSSGRSAVVEFIDGEMSVISNDQRWQVATNFLVSEIQPVGANSPCERYSLAYQALAAAGGSVSQTEAMAILQRVSSPNTVWSAVYDMTTGEIQLVMGRNYDEVHTFQMGLEKNR